MRDLCSRLISVNKAVYTKKQILSNNYLTLFTSYSTLDKAYERIDDYFNCFDSNEAVASCKDYLVTHFAYIKELY